MRGIWPSKASKSGISLRSEIFRISFLDRMMMADRVTGGVAQSLPQNGRKTGQAIDCPQTRRDSRDHTRTTTHRESDSGAARTHQPGLFLMPLFNDAFVQKCLCSTACHIGVGSSSVHPELLFRMVKTQFIYACGSLGVGNRMSVEILTRPGLALPT